MSNSSSSKKQKSGSGLRCPVDKEQVRKAVKALMVWYSKQQGDKQALVENVEDVFVTVALKKIPQQVPVKPMRIPLAHTMYGRDGQSVCVFVKDAKEGEEDVKEKVEEAHIGNVEQVLTVSELRREFKQYKDQRALLASYDLFLADERILRLLPALIGKKFFLRKKHPAAVRLSKADFAKEIVEARDSTFLYMSKGTAIGIRMAQTDFEIEHIVDNIMHALPHVANKLPRKWKNVQALFVKTANSVALPIYTSLPDAPVAGAAADTQSSKSSDKTNNKKQQRKKNTNKKGKRGAKGKKNNQQKQQNE